MLTHPRQIGFLGGNVALDIVAIVTSFVVYGVLNDVINRIWPAPFDEPEAAAP
jgi:hypothetical protein